MKRPCVLCGDPKGIGHHLSYDPEIVVYICRMHHIALHRFAQLDKRGRGIFLEWANQYGHLWFEGAHKYYKSPWYKKKKKQYWKKDYRRHSVSYKHRAIKWEKDHPKKAHAKAKRYRQKIMKDPIKHKQLVDRKRNERHRREGK